MPSDNSSSIIRNSLRAIARSIIFDTLPDRLQISLVYYMHFKKWPNLQHPTTFNEKIQRRKLYDRNPLFPLYMDKVKSKELVAHILGQDAIIPTLWEGNNPEDIPFALLEPPYVIKANHGSSMDHFVFDRDNVNREEIVHKALRWLKTDFSRKHREWAYSEIDRKILVEPFIGDQTRSPQDYRFWCFNGTVAMVQVDTDRRLGVRRAFFDIYWNRLELSMIYPPLEEFPRPDNLSEMIRAAEVIAAPFDFVRIDLYSHEGTILFGEATFYPVGGIAQFTPPSADEHLGRRWS